MEPEQKGLRFSLHQENIKEVHMGLAFHIPNARHRDVYPLDCLSMILGEGESSRLYQEIKAKRELVRSISAYAYTPSDPGLFIINAALDVKNLKKAFEEIYRTIIQVGKEGVREDELKKAKLNIEKDFVYDKETVQGQARKLGYFEMVFGDISFEKEYLKGIQEVTEDEVKGIVKRYFNSSNLTLVVLSPKGPVTGIEKEGITGICREIEEGLKAEEERKGRYTKWPDVVKMRLPNGITVMVKEDRSVPLVAVQAVFLGGLRFERTDNNGINNFLAHMLTKGTKKRNAFELAMEIEQMAGEIRGFSGRNSFGLSARFLSRFFSEGMELFSEVLLHPALDPEEIEKTRRLILAQIDRQEDELSRYAFLRFTKALYQRHPYGMNTIGSRESVQAIKRDDLLNYYRKHGVPENMVICIVGDVDTERAFSLVERCFGEFSGVPFEHPSILEEPPLEGKRVVRVPMEKRQVHILFGFPATTIFSQDRYPMEVLNTILSSQGGRLFVELRDREGLAYAIDSFFNPGLDPGYFGIYIATSPEKLKRAEEGIKRELQRILTDGVTEEEVERAKGNIVGTFEIGLQSYSSQAMTMALDERYGLGYEEMKAYPGKILAVTREDVLRVARKYIDLDRSVLVMVGPLD